MGRKKKPVVQVPVAMKAAQLAKRNQTLADSRKQMVALARVNGAAFNAYVLKDEMTGASIRMAPMHRMWQRLADMYPRLNLIAHVESAKALAVDTPIPTPNGWRTMGELQVGDQVFAGDGSVTEVVNATAVMENHRCYRVKFGDGAEVVADAEHLWLAWTDDGYAKGRGPLEVTTEEMLKRGVTVGTKPRQYPAYRWRVPVAGVAAYPEKQLPVHPYVLGAWLGDGNRESGRLTFHEDDRFIFDRCVELTGLQPGKPQYHRGTRVLSQGIVANPGHQGVGGGLTTQLRGLGVLYNKHIPEQYMQGSEAQRLELLAGLLDTDGTADKEKNRVTFCSAVRPFAEQVLELVRSLGIKAALQDHTTYFLVSFTACRQVFRLPRKAARLKVRERSKELAAKTIRAIDPVESVPVKCIQVSHPDHTYLCGRAYTVTHNSQGLSVGRVLYELGRKPNTRCVIVSNTASQAQKLVRTIAGYIENSEELKDVFPHLKKNPAGPWTLTQLAVERKGQPKDASVQAIGVHGSIVGARIDLLILDDVLDYENARTPGLRQDLWEWVHSTLFGRLTSGAKVISVGNAYHRDDLLHRLERNPIWHTVRFPVVDDEGNLSWPERWPIERINQKRDELGPLEFARQMLCKARDDADARFKKEWIDTCLRRGNGRSLRHDLATIPPGCSVYTGVDLAVQQHSSADLTAFTTILVWPNGDREILNIESGRLGGPGILTKIQELHHRYQGMFFVENNASQEFILQFLRASTSIPVRPFTTGRNKVHPEFGIEGVAAEMAAGKWIIPNMDGRFHSEVEALINEMLYYDPKAHTGDRLMSLYFAREAARQGNIRAEMGYMPTLRR